MEKKNKLLKQLLGYKMMEMMYCCFYLRHKFKLIYYNDNNLY